MLKSSMSVSPYSIAQFLNFVLKNKKLKVLSHWYMWWRRWIGGYDSDQSNQGLGRLPFCLHLLDQLFCIKMILFQFLDNYSNYLGVQIFRIFTVLRKASHEGHLTSPIQYVISCPTSFPVPIFRIFYVPAITVPVITCHFDTPAKTKMSRLMTKTTKWLCAQRRLRSPW